MAHAHTTWIENIKLLIDAGANVNHATSFIRTHSYLYIRIWESCFSVFAIISEGLRNYPEQHDEILRMLKDRGAVETVLLPGCSEEGNDNSFDDERSENSIHDEELQRYNLRKR